MAQKKIYLIRHGKASMEGSDRERNLDDDGKVQAINVTGVLGGSLRCDEPRPHLRGGRRGKHGGQEGANDSSESGQQ